MSTDDLTEILGLDPATVSWTEDEAEDADGDTVRSQLDLVNTLEVAQLASADWLLFPDDLRSMDDALKAVCKSALARQLFVEGMLDRNFSLYVSRFYGGVVSVPAMNFVLHVVQPSLIQVTAPLPERRDVEGVIAEAGVGMLDTRSALNINLVDHLISDERLEPVLRRIVDGSEDSKDFLIAYLVGGRNPVDLFRRLVPLWSDALKYAVGVSATDESLALQLVEVCLEDSSKGEGNQSSDATVAEFLSSHAAQIPIFATGATRPKLLAEKLASLGVRFPELAALEPAIRAAAAKRGLFDINDANLRAALGAPANWSLDSALAGAPGVFDRLVRDTENYLRVLPRSVPTVAQAEGFATVLSRAFEIVAEEQFQAILDRASRDLRVFDLRELPQGAWSVVLSSGRLEDNALNLLTYADRVETDAGFDRTISANPQAREWAQLTPEDRRRLAVMVAQRNAVAPLKRARYVRSLNLDQPLEVADLGQTGGEIYSYLAKFGELEDSLDTFTALSGRGWVTRSAYMKRAPDFDSYLAQATFDRDEIANVFRQPSVSPKTRQSFLTALPSLQSQITPSVAGVIAGYINGRKDVRLSVRAIHSLASAGCPGIQLAPILTRWRLTDEQLIAILGDTRKPWRELAATGNTKPKLPIAPGVAALLTRLKTIGTVSSWREEKEHYRVYLRR